ncbi:MAG: hypothetical protein K2L10_05430 [Ruminococcus sp.]|nr:hypothetical protein [Ruminococcus sp.]
MTEVFLFILGICILFSVYRFLRRPLGPLDFSRGFLGKPDSTDNLEKSEDEPFKINLSKDKSGD